MSKNRLPIKIELPPGFLEEELRSGYKVCSKQKKIWAVELDLLSELMRVCDKHNIKFQVFAGTLLGAVRHGGYIPWDDDLDVCMDRKNFNKLCKVAASEFHNPYFFQTATSDRKFFFGYARLRNSYTTGAIKWTMSPEYNNGIFIDVYVMDGLAPWSGFIKVQWCILEKISRAIAVCSDVGGESPKILGKLFRLIAPLISVDFLLWLYNFVLGFGRHFGNKVAQITHGSRIFNEHWLTKEELSTTELIKFEWIDVPVPADRCEILHRIYGEYLQFPPEEERGKWHNNEIIFDPDVPYVEAFRKGMLH